jgi:hypothetical protein
MIAVGASGKDFLIIVLTALVLYFFLSSSGTTPPSNVPQPPVTSSATETGPIFVRITNPGITAAIVRVVGTDQRDDLDQGKLSLSSCSQDQNISVWAPGYYIQTLQCDGTLRSYDATLQQVDGTDNPDYGWTGAGIASNSQNSCRSCHQGSLSPSLIEYDEWIKDGHSKAFTHPYFWTMYMGVDTNWRQSQQIKWDILDDGQRAYPILDPLQANYGAGYQLDYPVSNGNCVFCHAPAALPGTRREMDLRALIETSRGSHLDATTEGVTCDVCHKVTDVLVAKNQLPYDDRPGVLSMSILRPTSVPQFVSGPMAYQLIPVTAPVTNPIISTTRTCYPVFSESKFCAPCHYGKFSNTLIYGSYQEWLDSPYSKPESYRSCQDCHMLEAAQIGNTHRTERDACSATNVNFSNFSHNMMKYGPDPENNSREIPLLVQGAAQISLEPKLEGGQIKLRVTVLNTKAGHKFPTDSPLRHLILLVEARDWRNSPLLQTEGPRVPVWAAPDYGGYAGQIFANILKDKDTNVAPSFSYWNPVENAWVGSDTRLLPWVPAQSDYAFAAPYDRSAKITVKLIYRKAFMNVVQQKGWHFGDLDVKVTAAAIECTGFGTVPETITCQPANP